MSTTTLGDRAAESGPVAGSAPADLSIFRDPAVVTVLGASADPGKWGYWLARGALTGAHRRRVHLVNRHGAVIDGHPSVTSLSEIEGDLGLVVLCVPATAVSDAVAQALARGARGFVGITAGLDRATGRVGAEVELARTIRAGGARIIGPNCLGIYDASTDLRLAWGEFTPGALGIISQSGQLGSELANLAADRGLGVSRFVSVGNQVDVSARELVADLADHEATRVVALYVESFLEGRALADSLRLLHAAGKQTVLLTVGASTASQAAAASHTGSMTSALDVVDAACRVAGTVRVETPAQLVEVAQMLVGAPLPRGPRVAVVGDSGGQGAIAADVLSGRGLEVAGLEKELRDTLGTMLPPDAGVQNPIDLAGAGEQDLEVYAAVVERLLGDPGVDAVTMTGYFGSYGLHTPSLVAAEEQVARRIAEASRVAGKPVALHSMCRDSSTITLIRELGVPTYHTIEMAALALAGATRIGSGHGRRLEDVEPQPVGPTHGYLAARALLGAAGVGFPAAAGVRDVVELRSATEQLQAPYVLKCDWEAHKTEVGGVVLALADAESAEAAFVEMSGRLGEGQYVLEEMDTRRDTVELIVGARHDSSFGPVVVLGAGGVLAELLDDSVVELAPVDHDTARDMVARLRCEPLLSGWRGAPAVDREAVVDLVVAASRLICARPDLSDLELNPVRVAPGGLLAVDALVTSRQETP